MRNILPFEWGAMVAEAVRDAIAIVDPDAPVSAEATAQHIATLLRAAPFPPRLSAAQRLVLATLHTCHGPDGNAPIIQMYNDGSGFIVWEVGDKHLESIYIRRATLARLRTFGLIEKTGAYHHGVPDYRLSDTGRIIAEWHAAPVDVPADLAATPSVPWDAPVHGTPIADIEAVRRVGRGEA